MPFFTQKNRKQEFTVFYVSSLISRLYERVYGEQTFLYRDEILELSEKIYNDTIQNFGAGEHIHYNLESVLGFIKRSIEKPYLVEQFDLLFAPKQRTRSINWNVVLEQKEKQQKAFVFEQAVYDKHNQLKQKSLVVQLSQQDWIDFFEQIAIQTIKDGAPFAFNDIESGIYKHGKDYSKTDEEWYYFFYNLFFEFLERDPRIIAFIRAIQIRKQLCDILGISWLQGTGFNEAGELLSPTKALPKPNFFPEYDLSELFLSHLHHEDKSEIAQFLSSHPVFDLKYEAINWLSFNLLQKGNVLESINGNFELVQWMYFKCAWNIAKLSYHLDFSEIKPSAIERFSHITDRNSFIEAIFLALVNQDIVLPIQLLHDLSRGVELHSKNFALRLEDSYESIQNSITRAIIETKWNGSVSLDFSKIRKTGTPINHGLRVSNGISPYINMLYELVRTQGRDSNDLPINASIPVYHFELFSLFRKKEEIIQVDFNFDDKKAIEQQKQEITEDDELSNQYTHFDTLNRTVVIPDLFMQRVTEDGVWYLLDPYFFEKKGINLNTQYLDAEKMIEDGKVSKEHYKRYKANSIYSFLINMSQHNNVTLIFEDTILRQKNFAKNILPNNNGNGMITPDTRFFTIGLNFNNAFNNNGKSDINFIKNLCCLYANIYNALSKQVFIYTNLLGVFELTLKNIPTGDYEKSKKALQTRHLLLINILYALQSYSHGSDNYFNDYAKRFNESRQNAQLIDYLNEKQNNALTLENAFNLGVFFDKELSILANLSDPQIGVQSPLFEIMDGGKIRKVHSPAFIQNYQRHIVEHNIIEKTFLKKTFSVYKKYPHLFYQFYPNLEQYNLELEFYKQFVPLFTHGITLTCSNSLPKNELRVLIMNAWTNGIACFKFA